MRIEKRRTTNKQIVASFLVTITIFILTIRADEKPNRKESREKPVVQWIKKNAVPIKSESPTSYEDLSKFSSVLCKKELVLLGEGTHGTREFFLMKDKFVRYLVKRCSFKNLGMEYDLVDSLSVQSFIQTGKGNPEKALSEQRGWVWNTQEILGMVEWLRSNNRLSKNRANYIGIDMLRIVPPLLHSLKYLKSHQIEEISEAEGNLKEILGKEIYFYESNKDQFYKNLSGDAPIENNYRLKEITALLVDLYDFNKKKLVKETSLKDWELNKRIAFTAYQKSKHLLQWNMNNIFPTYGRKKHGALYQKAKAVSENLGKFFAEHDLSHHKKLKAIIDLISKPREGKYKYASLTIEERGRMRETLISSVERLKIRKHLYLRKVNEQRLDGVKSDLKSAQMIFEIYKDYLSKPALFTNEREIGLAENVEWLNKSTRGKTIIWSHNLHVSKQRGRESESMGSLLKKKYGDKMLVIGTTFNRGRFQAAYSVRQTNANTSKLREFEVGEAKEGSLEHLMAKVGYPVFFIDFRKLPKIGPVRDWFSKKQYLRSIGNSYNPKNPNNYYVHIEIPEHFDAMIFFDKTQRARPTKSVIDKYGMK